MVMHQMLLYSGSALLVVSFVWGYFWLEVLRDPKNELQGFWMKFPRTHQIVAGLNALWLPALLLGFILVAMSLFISERGPA
jgi:carbon starvation protein CstA